MMSLTFTFFFNNFTKSVHHKADLYSESETQNLFLVTPDSCITLNQLAFLLTFLFIYLFEALNKLQTVVKTLR